MTLTKKQVEEYIKGEGCPYCGDCNHMKAKAARRIFSRVPAITVPITCLTCSISWAEIYTLTSIEDHETEDETPLLKAARKVVARWEDGGWKHGALADEIQELAAVIEGVKPALL